MSAYNPIKSMANILGWCLMVILLTSCTNNYFEDENNFRIYVPQIERGEISNLYISFHDLSGEHCITRQIEAPFDRDDMMKKGILRFKIPYGEYSITAFADYAPGALTIGNAHDDSHAAKDLVDESINLFGSRTTNPRLLLSQITAYPIGHPEAKEPILFDIDEKLCYKGKVQTIFKDLPSFVERIDIYYKNLGTKVKFNGLIDRFYANDRVVASFKTSDHKTGDLVRLPADIINPSVGIFLDSHYATLPKLTTRAPLAPIGVTPESLELEVRYLDGENTVVGVTYFDANDLATLADNKKPIDHDGNPVSALVLEPQKGIIFTFSGFTIMQIQLMGWEDIDDGVITPM